MDENGTPEPSDYRYCLTHEEGFDFWKYDYDIQAAGHGDGCLLRKPTNKEYKALLIECKEMGCY